jgi:hypothetical protein
MKDFTNVTMDDGSSYYENILHSLHHEHTKDNIDRHVLVYEKWCRTFSTG